jgi:hypothetical protein
MCYGSVIGGDNSKCSGINRYILWRSVCTIYVYMDLCTNLPTVTTGFQALYSYTAEQPYK